MLQYLLRLLFYFIVFSAGFMFYRLWYLKWNFSEIVYHGPRASDVTTCTYYDECTNKYYNFKLKTFVCPPSVNKMFKYTNENKT